MAGWTGRLEGYLKALREGLRGLPDAEASEIVEELRSHVRDSAEGEDGLTESSVAVVLERLGPPGELASLYVTESLLVRAGRSRSPWLLFRILFRWATVSVAGWFVLVCLIIGYGLSASLLITAITKPFVPDRVGLWHHEDAFSLHLGFGDSGPGIELLGWWIVPVGLVAGTVGLWLTTRFGRWVVRRFRQTLFIPTR